jgi:hypothetical protein
MRALRVHLQDRGWYDEVTGKAQGMFVCGSISLEFLFVPAEVAARLEKPRFNDVYSAIHDFAISTLFNISCFLYSFFALQARVPRMFGLS